MTNKRPQYWKKQVDDKGIAWLHLNDIDASLNTLSSSSLKEFELILHQLEQDLPKGVIILSDKKSGFIAGADIKEFLQQENNESTYEYVLYCQSLFNRLEALACPSVAIIHGYCMGGGTELALACTYRIADNNNTRIALPEVKLGIHPGYGGSVRSIKLLGPLAAMDMMLTGRSFNARQSEKIGLVNYSVPERHLKNAAIKLILERPINKKTKFLHKIMSHRLLRPLIAQQLRKRVNKKASSDHYPAPFALIDLWEKYANSESMMKNEAKSIAKLLNTSTAQNLIRVFFLQTQMKLTGKQSEFKALHVHVIGAGTMGGDIAAWCAYKGLMVTLQDQSPNRIAPAIKRASNLFKKCLKPTRMAHAAMDRLIPDVHGWGVEKADVVIEAIFEDLGVKQELFKSLEPRVKSNALLCTNTSSIPLEDISSVMQQPERLTGLHFFNPVDRMQLIEVVHSSKTADEHINSTSSFAVQIGKLPLKVKSSPGFLVNRVLLPYLLEAVFMIQEGIPAPVIDQAALDFGMPMGPIALADKVGLDICLSVADILSKHYGGNIPDILNDYVSSGKLGVKTNQGFYEYKKGKIVTPTMEKEYVKQNYIQERLILKLLNETVACLREGVIETEDLIDAGIIFGTGFAPFRGGPLKYLHGLSFETQKNQFEMFNDKYGGRFIMDEGWKDLLC